MAEPRIAETPSPARTARAKYLTLAVLVAWVIAVFVFTLFKFSQPVI